MSIGTQLRQARESQSLSLDQAAQATHIKVHYLEALEADNFGMLPSAAQLRGFLRAYVDYLKLDENALFSELAGNSSNIPVTDKLLAPEGQDTWNSTNSASIFKQLGQVLQNQREQMGLSLGDVERHTHIRMHYIRALEEGDIGHLPSPVQGRGMLSNYASFLGLNTESILLRFADGLQASLYDRQAARNASLGPQAGKKESQVPARPSQFKRLFSMDFFVGGFLIIFLLAFTIWGAYRISRLRAGEAPVSTAPPVSEILLSSAAPAVSTEITPVSSQENSAIPTSLTQPEVITGTLEASLSPVPLTQQPPLGMANAPLQVYVLGVQRAWMKITVDGEVAYEGRVVPGSAYTFDGNERIELLTGDAAGLQVYFNQQDLGILGGFGEVVERIFSIEGVQTATPAVPPTRTPAPTGTVTPTPTPTLAAPTATPSPTLKP